MYKGVLKLNDKKAKIKLKKWANDFNRHFTKEDTRIWKINT